MKHICVAEKPGATVKVYSLYIEDDRYGVPTLAFVKGDGHEPRHWAQEYLEQSPHYRSVEVRADEEVLAKVWRLA